MRVVVRVKNCSAILQACVAFVPFACIFAYVHFWLPELLKRVKFSRHNFHAISLFDLFVEFVIFSEHACNTKLS